MPQTDGSFTSRWRDYGETKALDGVVLRIVARLAPGSPRALVQQPAARTAPRNRATVSVIIPCYNYARFLPDAVKSALGQHGVDVEIIVVDDRSTDDSREVAIRLAEAHPEVRLLVNPENVGHVRAFNAGWEASTGEFVVKLDADDLLGPDSLARALALFEAHPSVGLVYGHPRHFSTAAPPSGRSRRIRWTVWRGRDWLGERCRLGVSAITNPEMVLRSSILRELGPMDPSVAYAPDMEISMRIAAVSDVGYVGGADQALHREHPGSMSETDGAGILVDLLARRRAFERLFDRVGARLDHADGLRETAMSALADDALRYASSAADRDRPTAEIEALLKYARDTSPAVAELGSFRRLEAGSPTATGILGSLRRRALRRVRSEVYYSRWLARGV